MSDYDGRAFSFSFNKNQLISIIHNSSLGYDLLIDVEEDGIRITINDEEHFLNSLGSNLPPGKIRVKKSNLLYYLENNNLPENASFFVGDNIMACIDGNMDFGTIHVQSIYKQQTSGKITLMDEYLVDEILVLCNINLKHTFQKTLRHNGINHVIEHDELDQIKDWYRNEVITVVKSYMTDVTLIEFESDKDVQYIIEHPSDVLDNFKEECAESLLQTLDYQTYNYR